MPIDPVQLREEINTGPLAATLAPLVAARIWQGIADKLNDKTLGGAQVDEIEVSARQLLGCLVGSEYLALTQAQRDLWGLIIREASVNKAPIKATAFRNLVLAAIPSSASATRTALGALQTRTGSRIEILFGVGEIVGAAFIQAVIS